MISKEDFIDTVLDVNGFDFTDAEVRLRDSKGNGFYYRTLFEGNRIYEIYAPAEKRLSFFVELSLRHEIGHIILNQIWFKNEERALEEIQKVEDHRIFTAFQRFYYWNPVIRWIKRGLGFSTKINYGPDAERYLSNAGVITRAQDESFADYFALGKGDWK